MFTAITDERTGTVLRVPLLLASFTLEEIAALAQRLNTEKSDIGARRLHMVLERLLEPVSFGAPEERGRVRVDASFVLQRVEMVSDD